MKRNAFGQLVLAPHIRTVEDGTGGGGEFKAPESQEALDKIVNERLARERKKFDGFDDFKEKAAKWDAHEADTKKNDDKGNKPADGVSEQDVDKRIQDALTADRTQATGPALR